MLDLLANGGDLVVLLDGRLQGFALLGFVGVVLVGLAGEVAAQEEAEADQDGSEDAIGQAHFRLTPWAVTRRSTALPQVSSIIPQP